MYLQVNDGLAVFATHFIHTIINRNNEGVMRKLAPFQIEVDGIVVYPDQNILDIEWVLRELKISYSIEELQHNPAHIAKSQGIKYISRSEVIAHLLEDKEPKNQIIPNLKQKLLEKENKINNLETELESLKIRANKLEILESRLLNLEKKTFNIK